MKKNVRILLAALIVSLCMGGLTACDVRGTVHLSDDVGGCQVTRGRFVCLIFHIENTVLKR